MGTPFIGEIRMFAGSFAPAGWAFCDGQLLPISENDALFALIGTTYGGDGQETFALPELRGRSPIHQGNNHVLAESGGTETVTLTVNQAAAHIHPQTATSASATDTTPTGKVFAASTTDLYVPTGPYVPLAPAAVGPSGGSQPHDNRQPYLTVSFIISLFGIFPSQS